MLKHIAIVTTLAAGCTALDNQDVGSASQAETRNVLARGTIAGFSFKRKAGIPVDWEVKANASAPTDFVMSQIDLAAGECVPWHLHAGPVLVIIKAGTGTNYHPTDDGGCEVTTNPAGTALTDDGLDIHSMCNYGPEDQLTIFVTYLVPHGVATNIPVPNPGTCPGGAP